MGGDGERDISNFFLPYLLTSSEKKNLYSIMLFSCFWNNKSMFHWKEILLLSNPSLVIT